jgi:hypothetical protein
MYQCLLLQAQTNNKLNRHMKITNQTTDELMLKEGDAKGIMAGIVLVVVGIGVAFYSQFSPSIALWIAIAVFIIGLAFIFLSSSITVDANKTSGQIVYQTKRLIGGSTATYAVADVLRIETRKSWRIENNNVSSGRGISMPRQVLVLQSVIVFKDGQELPLDHQNSSSGISIGPAVMMGGSGKEVAIANQVATFLGVPFQEIAPPSGLTGINIGGGSGIQL